MWVADRLNVIKVIADPSAYIRTYFKKVGSAEDFEEILVEPHYLGGRTWSIETSFGLGTYLIKAINVTQGGEAFTTINVCNPTLSLEEIVEGVWSKMV